MTGPVTAVEPAEFPWYDYRGFTFSLGLLVGEHLFNSGHSGSAMDPAKGKPDVRGSIADQARIAYAKQGAVLAAAGLGFGDVTRVVENVTAAGAPAYAQAAAVRREVFGDHTPSVTTVLVDRLVRGKALIEIEVEASPGGGSLLGDGPAREGHGGTVYLPTVLPLDDAGDVVEGTVAEQYEVCVRRATQMLAGAGLGTEAVAASVRYVAGPAGELPPDALPGVASTIRMTRTLHPGARVALDVTASRRPVEVVAGGAAARAGDTVYLAVLTSSADGLRAQADQVYGQLTEVMRSAGADQLLSTVEYVRECDLADYRDVAAVRRERLTEPYPASTGIVCTDFAQAGASLAVIATALVTGVTGSG